MTLDEELTALSVELSGNFTLSFTYRGDNTWLIEIKSKQLRSSTLSSSAYRKIMDIAYKVDAGVRKGTYEATITNLDFSLNDGTQIEEDRLPVTVHVENVTSIEPVRNTQLHAYFVGDLLTVESGYAETVAIYSLTGVQLYSAMKDEDTLTASFPSLKGSLFIIKGSKSGTVKVVK